MFGFLKDKLKKAVGIFSKEVEKESTVEKKEVIKEVKKTVPEVKNTNVQKNSVKEIKPPQTKKNPTNIPEKYTSSKKEEIIIEKKPVKKDESKTYKKDTSIKKEPVKHVQDKVSEEVINIKQKKQGFFQKIFGKKEEEEIIEEKEELRAIAEKEIIEPEENIFKETSKEEYEEPSIEENTETDEINETKEEDINIENEKDEETIKDIGEDAGIIEGSEDKKTSEDTVEESEPVESESMKNVWSGKDSISKEPAPENHKGFFTKITETFTKFHLSEEKFEELFFELEVAMLENNVAVEVIEKIKTDMRKELMSDKINRKGVEELIMNRLKESIIELFDVEKIDLISRIKAKKDKPYIITIIGVNGSGKTTSIAKLTHKFQGFGLSVVLAASDTFRAAAIQQLEEHANRLNVKMIKHEYHSDPAAVAFDAIKYAEAKKIDVVIIDTAGRLHSNTNLMRELEKVIRVCKPDIKIFVGESITGNDCVEQAKEFDRIAGIDAIILAKADVDDKGGAAISVSYVTGKPILYLGTGQTYDDLKEFDSKVIIDSLEL